MKNTLLVLQTLSFPLLGICLIAEGHCKLGAAQFLLAAVNILVYS